jgi:hypothetical protein
MSVLPHIVTLFYIGWEMELAGRFNSYFFLELLFCINAVKYISTVAIFINSINDNNISSYLLHKCGLEIILKNNNRTKKYVIFNGNRPTSSPHLTSHLRELSLADENILITGFN